MKFARHALGYGATLAQKLAFYADRSGGPDACWPWVASIGHCGYGIVREGKRKLKAHRAAWSERNGPIPVGRFVLHRCDNRICTNPAHLWLGSIADNNADRDAKGRQSRGESVYSAKLNAAAVDAIRADGRRKEEIAAEFGVSASTVVAVRSRSTWKHIP